MPVDPAVLASNAAQLRRLEELAARLSEADLARDLGGSWSVAVALAHLAFWDRTQLLVLNYWSRHGAYPPWGEADDHSPGGVIEVANEILLPTWCAVHPDRVGALAVAAAREVDARVATLDDSTVNAVLAAPGEMVNLLRRANHRREHLDQIERGLFGTASSTASRDFIEAYYRAYNSGREEAVGSFLADEVVLTSGAGERQGREAYLATYRGITTMFSDQMTPERIEVSGKQAVVELTDVCRAKGDVPAFMGRSFKAGEELTLKLRGTYTVEAGKISRIEITRA